MPSVSGYRKGFGLKKGGVIDGFRVARVDVGHEQIEKYERYIYPTSLHLSAAAGPGVTAERAVEAVRTLTGGGDKKVLYSDYGNPYECDFEGGPQGELEVASEEEKEPAAAAAKKDQKQPQRCFVLHCCGLAVRRHDLPTQAQQANTYRGDEKQQPREPAAAADAERAARDRLKSAGGYALRKSRFSTSKCATCKETILPGQYIARAESHEGRGGWSHVGCIASSGVETAAAAAAAPTKPTPRGVATSADRADTSHKTAARTKKTASNDAPPEAEVPPRSTVSRKRK